MCRDAIGIKAQALPESQLRASFPNADGSAGNVNAYSSFLKNSGNTAAAGLRAGYTGFFDKQGALLATVNDLDW